MEKKGSEKPDTTLQEIKKVQSMEDFQCSPPSCKDGIVRLVPLVKKGEKGEIVEPAEVIERVRITTFKDSNFVFECNALTGERKEVCRHISKTVMREDNEFKKCPHLIKRKKTS